MKKVLFIGLPLLVIGGGVVGAAMMGAIDIPGLTPAKKKSNATAQYSEPPEESPVVQRREPAPEATPAAVEPPPDMVKGRKALAKLWNEIDAAKILEIVRDWQDDELAEQLRYLEPEKTAEVLGIMKADRASKISKLLQVIVAKEEIRPA